MPVPAEEKTFELGAAVAGREGRLKEFRKEYDRKSRERGSDEGLAVFTSHRRRGWRPVCDCQSKMSTCCSRSMLELKMCYANTVACSFKCKKRKIYD
jgi:hypothetical protein